MKGEFTRLKGDDSTRTSKTKQTTKTERFNRREIGHQKDLGGKTEEIAKGMKIYDPDPSCNKFEEQSPWK